MTKGIKMHELSIADVDHYMQHGDISDPRWVRIKPLVARHILECYNDDESKNRTRKPGVTRRYADDISSNKWGLTGDTIKFSKRGLLEDGQHRLQACVDANKPISTLLVHGVDWKQFVAIDQGKIRSAADVFQIAGVHYYNDIAAAAKWMYILTRKNPFARDMPQPRELLDLYKKNWPDLEVARTKEVLQARKGSKWPMGFIIAMNYIMRKSDVVKAGQFWADIAVRDDQVINLVIKIGSVMNDNNGRIHDRLRMVMVAAAWNEYLKGHKVKQNTVNNVGLPDKHSRNPEAYWPGID